MKRLNQKQQQVLNAIVALEKEHGRMPTFQEIANKTDFLNSASSVQRYMQALIDANYIMKDQIKERTLKLASGIRKILEIPLVGRVACGIPFLAIENVEAYIPVNSELAQNKDDYFFLKASGDSMNLEKINGKNIDDGDFILIKKQNVANINDVVVALIGDEATLKKYDIEDGLPVLKPNSNNPIHKKIILIDDPMIQGVAVDVIKAQ